MEINCSFCGQPVCEDPSRCDFAAEHEADLVASATLMISIPKTEHERLLADSERCERLEAILKALREKGYWSEADLPALEVPPQ